MVVNARVGLQLGHVPRTSGVTGTGGCCGTTEQQYVTRLYDTVAPKLVAAGHTPIRILADPTSYPVCDVFVAMHCDGSTDSSARGCSFGYRTDQSNAARSKALGDKWRERHNAVGYPGGNRGTNYTTGLANYYALDNVFARNANVRAIVAEFGFLTNPSDSGWLTSNYGKVADAIVQTVVHFYGGTAEEDDFPVWSQWPDNEKQAMLDAIWNMIARGKKVDGTTPTHLVDAGTEKIRGTQTLILYGDGRTVPLDEDTHGDASVKALRIRVDRLTERLEAADVIPPE
jgi:N-acetylmuramoyl-L-alanine amidase